MTLSSFYLKLTFANKKKDERLCQTGFYLDPEVLEACI